MRKKRSNTPRYVKGRGYITTVGLLPEVFFRLKKISTAHNIDISALINEAVKRTMWTDKDYLKEQLITKELELQHLHNKMNVLLLKEEQKNEINR